LQVSTLRGGRQDPAPAQEEAKTDSGSAAPAQDFAMTACSDGQMRIDPVHCPNGGQVKFSNGVDQAPAKKFACSDGSEVFDAAYCPGGASIGAQSKFLEQDAVSEAMSEPAAAEINDGTPVEGAPSEAPPAPVPVVVDPEDIPEPNERPSSVEAAAQNGFRCGDGNVVSDPVFCTGTGNVYGSVKAPSAHGPALCADGTVRHDGITCGGGSQLAEASQG
jgi:hypothetical protein